MVNVLLTRRWIVRHTLILLAVWGCLAAGGWQLHRLSERRARNARIASQRALAPLEITAAPAADTALRRASASGQYDTSREILLRDRSLDGRPGSHLLTPLLLGDGSALLVDRGWVPLALGASDVRAAGPAGIVRSAGLLLPPERPRPLTRHQSPATAGIARIDLGAVAERLPYRLAPVYLLLASQDPPQRQALPAVVPPPDLKAGPPHLSYAVQWFTFAAIALGGHVILARRALRT